LGRDGQLLEEVDCSVPLGATTGHPVAKHHGWLRGATHLPEGASHFAEGASHFAGEGASHLPEGASPLPAGGETARFLVGQSCLHLFVVEFGEGAPRRRGPLEITGLEPAFAAQRRDPGLAVYSIAVMPEG
jgi:hypothetical protein